MYKSAFVSLIFFYFTISSLNAQSKWKGFERIDFQFQEREARIIIPNKAANGNPWIWRARFPDWHTDADSILVAEGFHLVYINTDNKFGSPDAVKVWDNFYDYVSTKYTLQKKVALMGVSRGGLFVYNWAKQNPEKVACIYAEAPVCDFTSWPGGFGEGKGSLKSWEILKAEYGFNSDEEAKNYKNNPIDNLAALAKAKVPIMHMIGLEDQVVPPKENSLILINRYIELGGIATVVPCTEGKQELEGHHFEIETPRYVADFIKYNTLKKGKLNSEAYHTLGNGLKNSHIKFEKHKKGRVAFLGGSITHNPGWRDSVSNYLTERFPKTEFEFIAAGIPSMGSTPAAFRLTRDIKDLKNIDLLFEEAAVNDPSNGRTALDQKRALEGIVRHLKKENPAIDIVLMHFVDPSKIKDYNKGIEPDVIQNHNTVAKYYNLPIINLAKEVTDRINNKEFTWEDDFKNLHPSPFGQGVYAHSMIQFLENSYSSHIDADDKIVAQNLPNALDIFSYENGKLIDIKEAKLSKGWAINNAWSPSDDTGVRPNYHDVPMLISENPGSKLTYNFSGKAVGIAVAAGQDAGYIEYKIDNGAWQKLNLFTPWSASLHLPWYYTLSSELENKNHKLQIKVSETKDAKSNGNACRIRYFYINE
ncbi:SGNH/GDSL hydrolase family protein [Arcticibacterium luteifluviistationis]|uniref:SGNH/GDSL hydrolase family protein n=1 Tax=Arcticibacterium luteifluviistationis TaxID=1784714 RepID=A0A2Z4GAP7_9BACT|nr:GDSL-type esterase/lipase family protein [Arcticibacterium luteifluviistationis]AWV98342.1 SGNH/GDSL hydrolase family protein [Arcticibacterium luteifluviistationis]